jgi:hypothetical protein
MQNSRRILAWATAGLVLTILIPIAFEAQEAVVLPENELSRVVPAGFYFDGQSAATQMYNAAAVRFGTKRHIIAALVDSSGYATAVREKCEGFLISDLPFRIGGKDLGVGTYAFGFTKEGMMNVFDLSGAPIISVKAARDAGVRTPRPLTMVKGADGIRLYRARDYVVVAAK